ncbi:MAG: hypothetical protein GY940_32640 [bacterium]|nr:hypothetical protein [bacterium]
METNRTLIYRKAVLILVVVTLLYCGKKGPLKLDPELKPQGIDNFKLSQVGQNIKLQWDFKTRLLGKSKDKKKTEFDLEKISKIHIHYSDKVISGGKFRKKSTLLRKLLPGDLTEVKVVDPFEILKKARKPSPRYNETEKKNLSFYINIPFQLKDLDDKSHYFAIQYYYYKKKKSPISEVLHIRTLVPVKPVTGLALSQENKMIRLTWDKPGEDAAGNKVTSISGYDIFKKIDPDQVEEQENQEETGSNTTDTAGTAQVEPGVFKKLNTTNVLTEYFEDTDTGINGKYTYYVSTIISNLIESAQSQEVFLRITDIYPPEIPANLVSFKASDHMFLTWKEVTDKDFSFYRVYRRTDASSEFRLIADKVTTSQYKDQNPRRGRTYYYVVTSVDKKGNESEYSNVAREQF